MPALLDKKERKKEKKKKNSFEYEVLMNPIIIECVTLMVVTLR